MQWTGVRGEMRLQIYTFFEIIIIWISGALIIHNSALGVCIPSTFYFVKSIDITWKTKPKRFIFLFTQDGLITIDYANGTYRLRINTTGHPDPVFNIQEDKMTITFDSSWATGFAIVSDMVSLIEHY